MSDTHETETKKDSLEERSEAATDSRTLDEIEQEDKTLNPADAPVPSPDAPARDREGNQDAGDPV
jgi:hypothetical protein